MNLSSELTKFGSILMIKGMACVYVAGVLGAVAGLITLVPMMDLVGGRSVESGIFPEGSA
jgi:hypothetical protein